MQHTLFIFSNTDMAPIFARAMTSAVGAEEVAGGCAAGLSVFWEAFEAGCATCVEVAAIAVAA